MRVQNDIGVLFKNNSSSTIPPYGVMRVTGSVIDAAGRFYLTVDQPNTSYETYYEVNGPFAVKAGAMGVTSESPCRVAYDSGTPAYGNSWGAKSGQWTLSTGRDGFKAYGNLDSTKKLAYFRQREVTSLIGKLGADLAAGSTATCTVWLGAGGSEASSEYSVTLRDWLIPSTKKISNGASVIGTYINGVWYLTEAGKCPVTA